MALPIKERRMHFQETSTYRGIMPYPWQFYKNDFVGPYNPNTFAAFSAISLL
jgi:hypothetical protein